jgi:hypothetical protein
MTLKNSRLAPKITDLFDSLESSINLEEYEKAEITVSKLSKYFHLFDDEHTDYYQYAQDLVVSKLNGVDEIYDDYDDDYLFDWDGDALASAGFGVDENY